MDAVRWHSSFLYNVWVINYTLRPLARRTTSWHIRNNSSAHTLYFLTHTEAEPEGIRDWFRRICFTLDLSFRMMCTIMHLPSDISNLVSSPARSSHLEREGGIFFRSPRKWNLIIGSCYISHKSDYSLKIAGNSKSTIQHYLNSFEGHDSCADCVRSGPTLVAYTLANGQSKWVFACVSIKLFLSRSPTFSDEYKMQ